MNLVEIDVGTLLHSPIRLCHNSVEAIVNVDLVQISATVVFSPLKTRVRIQFDKFAVHAWR